MGCSPEPPVPPQNLKKISNVSTKDFQNAMKHAKTKSKRTSKIFRFKEFFIFEGFLFS